jgi:hypothetical protein
VNNLNHSSVQPGIYSLYPLVECILSGNSGLDQCTQHSSCIRIDCHDGSDYRDANLHERLFPRNRSVFDSLWRVKPAETLLCLVAQSLIEGSPYQQKRQPEYRL